ncbi:MAG: cellobiose phosphorylase, partial [Candidatus Omnitrophica bacterium]|nr:cellobiose phosphorylase [Candidatus Omnitrophota bacterium]
MVTDTGKIWSATGVSKNKRDYTEKVCMQGGLLWHQITRKNQTLGLTAEIINFIPAADDQVEIMSVKLTNNSKKEIKFKSIAAIPMYARSADNLRDHRHVTSLLHRIQLDKNGVLVTPTMTFDERGHNINELTYAVLGVDEKGSSPKKIYPTVECFIGEGGSFEYPKALFEQTSAANVNQKFFQGKEAMGALEFGVKSLKPGQSTSYIILMGIAADKTALKKWITRYGSSEKTAKALVQNRKFWEEKSNQVKFTTHNPVLDNWLKWVGLQPTFRKIFGNSFLPDFDYGRGGRGWRDLWQDCLALLLTFPEETKAMLLHNFGGIRIDGSNATIISTEGYKFIADRNQITRVWMDHGVWPLITTELYIHESGDIAFLLKKAPYFRDPQLSRAHSKDAAWSESYGTHLKTQAGKIYKGTLIEHILIQHLVQFFNVGPHNHIRLENADWNDGLDMAADKGESVAFTCFYAGNLKKIATLLSYLSAVKGVETIEVLDELGILLDSLKKPCAQYSKIEYKLNTLEKYYKAVQPRVSGKTKLIKISELIHDLKAKSEWMVSYIRKTEWVTSKSGHSFYNGYYDNKARRVEGDHKLGLRMALTSQTFSVMSGVATDSQVAEIIASVDRYLRDSKLGGVRLNTDFKEIQPDLGRAFSFAYGEKENGAFFNHMQVMYAFALYYRGFVKEGYKVLSGIHKMSINTKSSKIYPGLPEYFNSEGRGLYHYLTGSASWLITTYLTQVFGIMGHLGDLLITPKLG